MKTLDLYITKICNLNCDYCYVDIVKSENTSLSGSELTQRINLLDFDCIKFFGGEPLIKWQQIQEIIESISFKKPEMKFSIISNGLLLNQKKVDYILRYKNLEVLISLHDHALDNIKKKLHLIQKLGNQTGLYIIFDPRDFSKALKKFLFFFSNGVKYFTFAPEIYGSWSDTEILEFKKILNSLSVYIKKYNLKIGGLSTNRLKPMNFGCEKYIYNEIGEYKMCNRFQSLSNTQGFTYREAYNYFDHEINYKSDPNRWFYVCPVGWYLDHKDDNLKDSLVKYKKLNHIMIDFFREINSDSLTFLSRGIEEIRFNITEQCNIRCEYCYVDFKNKHLDFITGKNIIDFFLEQEGNEKILSFFGGEPLLQFQMIKKLVYYAEKKGKIMSKKMHYKIATNFMLVNDEIITFLKEYNFEIHISINGETEINNIMRDNSSKIVYSNIETYFPSIINKEIVVALFAFSPDTVESIYTNMLFLYYMGFRRINIEMIFGKNIHWSKNNIKKAISQIVRFYHNYNDVKLENLKKNNIFLDIDTTGKCAENSLEFHGTRIDMKHKEYFIGLLKYFLG